MKPTPQLLPLSTLTGGAAAAGTTTAALVSRASMYMICKPTPTEIQLLIL